MLCYMFLRWFNGVFNCFQTQNVCKSDEWDDFIRSLKTDLPTTFRITGSRGEAKKMLDLVQGEFITQCLNQNGEGDGKDAPTIFALPWYVSFNFYSITVYC